MAQRSRYLTKHPKNILKYPKIDYRAFSFSRRHYAGDNRTARDIHNVGLFWVVKIQGGNAPLPPDKNIPAHRPLYACARSSKWSSTFLKITPPRPKPAYAHAPRCPYIFALLTRDCSSGWGVGLGGLNPSPQRFFFCLSVGTFSRTLPPPPPPPWGILAQNLPPPRRIRRSAPGLDRRHNVHLVITGTVVLHNSDATRQHATSQYQRSVSVGASSRGVRR